MYQEAGASRPMLWAKVHMAALIERLGPFDLVSYTKQGTEGGMGKCGCLFVGVCALSSARCLAK